MKVPTSVRQLYDSWQDKYLLLHERVDARVLSFKEKRWHYESRIKSVEGFALKLESARTFKNSNIDDYLACTIVVENIGAIPRVEDIIGREFVILERRPRQSDVTKKRPEEFTFDDLRFYLGWLDDPALPESGINDLVFELQIKTFLQHAWSISTHDLTYKSDEIKWSKRRIAFQVKAMLEHAELSINEAEILSNSISLNVVNEYTQKLTDVMRMVRKYWTPDKLPSDMIRLSENIYTLLNSISIHIAEMDELLSMETTAGRGAMIGNLSPYGIITQIILQQKNPQVVSYLKGNRKRVKIFVPKEIELPENISSLKSDWIMNL